MASPNLSEIITTTLRNRSGKLADNVSDNNAILYRLRERGGSKPSVADAPSFRNLPMPTIPRSSGIPAMKP